MLGLDQWWNAVIAFVAALGGGVMNALAGGGTILTFPTLVALGLYPVTANVTSAVALWPGGFGAVWGFRNEIASAERWWLWLAIPSLVGGALGAFLLISLPSHIFTAMAPYLVLIATGLIALERPIEGWLHIGPGEKPSRGRQIVAILLLFAVAIYGGYFGASLGILILTALSLVGVRDIGQANGLKNLFSLTIKGVAVIYFAVSMEVVWDIAILMAVGAIIGGYAAGELGHRMKERVMRWVIVAIGLIVAIVMIVRLA